MALIDVKGNKSAIKSVMNNRNFRLLWIGEGISLIGDQFYLIALPWLVLQMTGDALAVGGVFAAAGIPRAIFMLVGGALTDKFSSKMVMFYSNILRMIVVITLSVLAITNTINLWILYGLVLVFGIADAFFFPAQNTIVPHLIKKEQLQIGNAIIQGTAQISRFGGPVLAGIMIALLGRSSEIITSSGEIIPDLKGIGFAFGIEAISFLISAITLWMIKTPKKDGSDNDEKEIMWISIKNGLASVWNDKGLRLLFMIITGVNFLVIGPILVGIPVLANTRYSEGAISFGIIISAFGGGNLLGTILAGTLPALKIRNLGLLISVLGIGVSILGLNSSVPVAAVICLILGVANGYVTIIFITWLQARTPPELLGRVMSVMIFFVIGLNPVSMMLSGFFTNINITMTFFISGILMTIIVLLAYFSKSILELGEDMISNNNK